VLNGKYFAGMLGDKLILYPVDGGAPETPPGVASGERLAGWGQDGRLIFLYTRSEFPYKVYRLDRMTGKRDLLLEVTPSDRAGATGGGGSWSPRTQRRTLIRPASSFPNCSWWMESNNPQQIASLVLRAAVRTIASSWVY
jgi:hypothetical protein